jgi:hypothetical protein
MQLAAAAIVKRNDFTDMLLTFYFDAEITVTVRVVRYVLSVVS